MNPDAPDLRWAYKVGAAGNERRIRSELILRELDQSKVADDTRAVSIDLVETHGVLRVAEDEKGMPRMQDLKSVKEYQGVFPNPTECFQPQEISADLIAGWVTGNPEGNAKHPLRTKIGGWVQAHLQ